MSTSNLEIRIKTLIEGLDVISKLGTVLNGLTGQITGVQSGATSAGTAIRTLESAVTEAQASLEGLTGRAQATQVAMGDVAASAQVTGSSLSSGLSGAEASLAGLTTAAQTVAEGLGAIAAQAEATQAGLSDVGSQVTQTAANLSTLQGRSTEAGAALSEVAGQAQQAGRSLESVNDGASQTATDLTAIGTAAQEAGRGLGAISTSTSTAQQGLQGLSDHASRSGSQVSGLSASSTELSASLSRMEAPASSAAQGLSDLTQEARGGAANLQGLSDTSQSLSESLGGLPGALGESATALGSVTQEAEDTSTGMTDLSGNTGQVAQGIADFSQWLTDTGRVLIDFRSRLGEVSGSFTDTAGSTATLTGAFSDVATASGSLDDSLGGLSSAASESGVGLDGLGERAGNLTDTLGEIGDQTEGAQESFTNLGEAASGTGIDLNGLSRNVGSLVDTIDNIDAPARSAGHSLDEMGSNAGSVGDRLDSLGSNAEDLATSFDGVPGSAQEAAGGIEEIGSTASDVGDTLGDLGGNADDLAGSLGDLADSTGDVSDGIGEIGDAAGPVGETIGDLGSSVGDLGGALGEVPDPSGEAQDGIDGVSESAGTGQTALEELAKAIRDLTAQLGRAGTQAQETEADVGGLGDQTQETGGQTTSLRDRLKALVQQLGLSGTAAGDAADDLIDFGTSANAGQASTDALMGAAKKLFAALTALAGLSITFDYLKEAASYAGRVETLGITLGVVGENAGYTKAQLAEFEKSLKATGISTESARDSMTQMMQAGIALGTQLGQTTPQVTQLARAAQDLAVVTGENSSETLQRLVTNISQMDTMGLRFMGIMVDVQAAQDKFALSLNTTAGALTNAQKVQAVYNEVMAQSVKMSGSYEMSMEAVGKKVTSLSRYMDELSLSIGNKLLPSYSALVDSATHLLKSLQKQADAFDSTGEIGKTYGEGLAKALEPLVPILTKIFTWVMDLAGAFAPTFEAAGSAIGDIFGALDELLSLVGDGAGVIDVLKVAVQALGVAFGAVADGIHAIKMVFDAAISVFSAGISKLESFAATIGKWVGMPKEWTDEMEKASGAMDKLSEESGKSAGAIFKEFADGKSHIGEFVSSLFDAVTATKKIDPTPAQRLREEIIALNSAQSNNTKSSVEVVEGQKQIKAALDDALASNKISQKEYDSLTLKLDNVGKKVQEDLVNAFTNLGTSVQELSTGIASDTATIIGSLQSIAQNGNATASQFQEAFAANVSVAKNIEELNAFSDLLVAAGKRWPDATLELRDAQAQIGKNFEEIYQKELEAMSTREQWGSLEETIVKMGKNGTLSIEQVNVALQQGKEAVNALEPAYVAAASAADKLGASSKSIGDELEKLNSAIAASSEKIQTAFSNMTSGYDKLIDAVKTSSSEQVAIIEKRYDREVALIDASVTSTTEAEKLKLAALQQAEVDKINIIESSATQELAYIDQSAQKSREAAQAKLAALNEETAKVEEALGKDTAAQDEYTRKLKDLANQRKQVTFETEEQIRQKKLDVITRVKESYAAMIDKLNAEEQRHLDQVKSIEDEIRMAKMTTEERIKEIQKSGLSEFQQYEQTKSEVAEYQAKAREAASKGEWELAKTYLDKAKDAATELNQTVQEGDKVYVDKTKAIENATKALIQIGETEVEILNKQKDAHVQMADTAVASAERAKVKVMELTQEQERLREESKKGIEMNITANNTQAQEKVREVKELVASRDNLMEVKANVDQAKSDIENLMQAIKKGETSPVEVDVTKGREALERLKAYAEQTSNMELHMQAEQALAQLGTVKGKVEELNQVKTESQHKVVADDSEAQAKIDGIAAQKPEVNATVKMDDKPVQETQQTLTKLDGTVVNLGVKVEGKESVDQAADAWGNLYDKDGQRMTTYADVITNAQDTSDKIYKITALDGTVTYSDHTVNTNAGETEGKIEQVHTTWGGRTTISEANVNTNAGETKQTVEDVLALGGKSVEAYMNVATNADETKAKVDIATTPVQATSTVTVNTNADETKAKVDAATTPKDAQATVTINTNADETKKKIDTATAPVDAQSKVTINTNADETKQKVEQATTPKDGQAKVTITTNADEVKAKIDSVLLQKQVTSTHNITTDAESKKPLIETALTQKDVSSTHNISTDAVDKEPLITRALQQQTVSSSNNITTNALEVQPVIQQALQQQNVNSAHTITTNASEIAAQVESLSKIVTQSMHYVSADISEALAAIAVLRKPTYSVHTVYVVKSFMFAHGGEVEGDLPHGAKRARLYPFMSSGVVPGSGSQDTVPRTLEQGSFVLRKQAVNALGVGRVQAILNSASQLPGLAREVGGKVQAMLTPGEVVFSRSQADRIGRGKLHYLNSVGQLGLSPDFPLHFAGGGEVGAAVGSRTNGNAPSLESTGVKGSSRQVVDINLRSDRNTATVTADSQEKDNLLLVLNDLKMRASVVR